MAKPDEEASHPLDELIATIDEEVEEVWGPGAMADLAPAEPIGAAGEEQHVIFTLASTEYAVPIANVIEIGRPVVVTPVPSVPDWVLGVANLRGDVISMVDLRAFLGMEWKGLRTSQPHADRLGASRGHDRWPDCGPSERDTLSPCGSDRRARRPTRTTR